MKLLLLILYTVSAVYQGLSEDNVCMIADGIFVRGTCFFIDANLILTNYHVLNVTKNTTVVLRSKAETQVEIPIVLKIDVNNDIALLKTKRMIVNDYIPLGKDAVRGAKVKTMGHPKGMFHSYFEGYVANSDYIDRENNVLMLNVACFYGSSGSPVVNTKNELVGMIYGMDDDMSNIGFAIKIGTIRKFLKTDFF